MSGKRQSASHDAADLRRSSVNLSITQFTDFFEDKKTLDLNLPKVSENTETNYIGETFSETYKLNRLWLRKFVRFLLFYVIGVS